MPATPESLLADDNQPLRAEACGAKGGMVKSVAKKTERIMNERKNNKKYAGKGKCAAGFALLNLPKGKSLGRSKPETNSSNEQAH